MVSRCIAGRVEDYLMDDKLIEIRARAIYEARHDSLSRGVYIRPKWEASLCKDEYREYAKATIEAEQAAGYRTINEYVCTCPIHGTDSSGSKLAK